MRQLFFIAPKGQPQVAASGVKASHYWFDGARLVGVVELMGGTNAENIIDKFEAAGIMWLPNHLTQGAGTIAPEHAAALAKHGVLPTDGTAAAMTKVHAKSGFPPLKPVRF